MSSPGFSRVNYRHLFLERVFGDPIECRGEYFIDHVNLRVAFEECKISQLKFQLTSETVKLSSAGEDLYYIYI